MTRKEEIQKLIDEEMGTDNYGSSDYQLGVCDGVRLADETMIDKACEWLCMNMTSIEYFGINGNIIKPDFIQRFKKALKGE
jgi:hypothetical protein